MGVGELFALGAALMWTLSSMIWGRIHLSALGMNLCKNIIATLFLIVHVFAIALIVGTPAFSAPLESWGWLALSGIIGIVIGDTVYFRSLQILGPRLSLLVATTAPLFSALLGWSLLGEDLKWFALLGILMTVGGVIFVVADRKSKKESPGLFPGQKSVGVMFGIGGAVSQAIGGVFAKKGMVDSAGMDLCNPIEASLIRIGIAAIVTTLVVFYKKQLRDISAKALKWEMLRILSSRCRNWYLAGNLVQPGGL